MALANVSGFGGFGKDIIRNVAQPTIIRLNEHYAGINQTGYVSFMRTDGKLLNAGAVKLSKHADNTDVDYVRKAYGIRRREGAG
ncbi:hypothetical protein [Spirosoma fluminis]